MQLMEDLDILVIEPREDLGVEYKDWLDLTKNDHRATIAKAAIALVNHGGGFIIIGFAEMPELSSVITHPLALGPKA